MVDDSAPDPPFPVPPDDKTDDAVWLADMIQALRMQFTQVGHQDVAAMLDDAFAAAEAAAGSTVGNAAGESGDPHREP